MLPDCLELLLDRGGVTHCQEHAVRPFGCCMLCVVRAVDTEEVTTWLLFIIDRGLALWTTDDGTVSIFTKDGVTVHKEQDVLIIVG